MKVTKLTFLNEKVARSLLLNEKEARSTVVNKKWQTRNNIDPVKILNFYIGNYDNFLVVGDFNSEMLKFVQSSMDEFCSICNLHNVCDKAACYKNP